MVLFGKQFRIQLRTTTMAGRIMFFCIEICFLVNPVSAQKLFFFGNRDLNLSYFGTRYSYLVPHVVNTCENALHFHDSLWSYPDQNLHIFLTDISDFGNGGAINMPYNQVIIGIEPYSFAFSIIPSSERFQWLFNHELTHIALLDRPNQTDRFFRKVLLGKVQRNEQMPVSALWSYYTTPRWYAPRWYHEGMACFMETWMSGGLGRAMGGYDEMYFRTLVNEHKPIYSVVGLETEGTTIDFQVGANSYLYGTRFVDYLANQYGIGKLKAFYLRSDDSKRFFGSQFKKVYQKSLKTAWDEWIIWEQDFQTKNIEQIRTFPLTPFRALTKETLGSVSKYGYNFGTRKVYMAINHPGILSQVAELDLETGKIRKVATLDSPALYYSTHLAYNRTDEKIYISEHNSSFRSLVEIDVRTGRKKTLIPFSRTGDLAFNSRDRCLWGIMHDNGYSVLVKIPEPYTKVIPMYSADFGLSLFDLSVSNDGSMLSVSLTGVKGEMSLILFQVDELEKGIKQYRTLYYLEDNSLCQFQFSSDDRYLIGTSYYTGVSNVFRLPVEGEGFELLSNTETGFFMPLQVEPDSLMVLKFMRDGMMPGKIQLRVIDDANPVDYLGNRIAGQWPEVRSWSLPPPSPWVADTNARFEGEYYPLRQMALTEAYPDIAGFKNTLAMGYRLRFSDPVGISALNLFLGTSPWSTYVNNQKWHVQLDWKYWDWKLTAAWNPTDFYDLFGPTKHSRAGYELGLAYRRPVYHLKPFFKEYGFNIRTYGHLEVLPAYQNVSLPVRSLHLLSGHYAISKLRRTLGGVEDETGFDWKVKAQALYAQNQLFPALMSDQSFGVMIPFLRNTSFWLRNNIGQSFGPRSSVLSNFYFGGFRNNYVDWQPSTQYREALAFPGVEIDEIAARNYIKTMGELNLKPIRFRNFGTTWLYPIYMKPSFFSTHIITDLDRQDLMRNIFNFGGQVDIQLVLFSYLKTTWSAGYARKFEKGVSTREQWMFSLKLLGN